MPCIGRWILNHWTTKEVHVFLSDELAIFFLILMKLDFRGQFHSLLSEARSPRHRFLSEFNDSHEDRWPVEDGLDSDN